MASLSVYCVQYDISWENKSGNRDKVSKLISDANPKPGSLIVLPEMFETGFSMNVQFTSDDEQRSGAKFLSQLATSYESWVIAGLVERSETDTKRALNRALVFDPSGIERCAYSKMHLFSPGSEDKHFVHGVQPAQFEIDGFRIAPLICYDLRFPELFRQLVLEGVELFVVIASWPSKRSSHWCSLLQARAIENQAFVVGVNRCGEDPSHSYSGRSQVIDPRGEILMDAGNRETVLQIEIDRENLLTYRSDFPVLKDIRK